MYSKGSVNYFLSIFNLFIKMFVLKNKSIYHLIYQRLKIVDNIDLYRSLKLTIISHSRSKRDHLERDSFNIRLLESYFPLIITL